jgi:hypothetical protein
MLTEPVRAAPLLAAACTVTVPLPVPDPPAVTVSQAGVLLPALQAQPAPVVTLTLSVPPLAPTESPGRSSVKLHPGAGTAA